MEVKVLTHRGTQIVYADYRGARTPEEMVAHLECVMQTYVEHPLVSRGLINVSGTHVDRSFMDAVKLKLQRVASLEHKVAMVGISGIQRVLVSAIVAMSSKGKRKVFSTEQEALDWLASGE
jgi:hypothetical protein